MFFFCCFPTIAFPNFMFFFLFFFFVFNFSSFLFVFTPTILLKLSVKTDKAIYILKNHNKKVFCILLL
jgi:hypothetical protein